MAFDLQQLLVNQEDTSNRCTPPLYFEKFHWSLGRLIPDSMHWFRIQSFYSAKSSRESNESPLPLSGFNRHAEYANALVHPIKSSHVSVLVHNIWPQTFFCTGTLATSSPCPIFRYRGIQKPVSLRCCHSCETPVFQMMNLVCSKMSDDLFTICLFDLSSESIGSSWSGSCCLKFNHIQAGEIYVKIQCASEAREISVLQQF